MTVGWWLGTTKLSRNRLVGHVPQRDLANNVMDQNPTCGQRPGPASLWVAALASVTAGLPVTRERFSDLIPCTLFPQRPQYSEVPAAFCRLWPPSEFLRAYSQRSPP